MDQLANLIEAILDQTTDNEIKVSISRNKQGYMEIVVADNLGEIGSTFEIFTERALHETITFVQSFVDDQAQED